MSAHDIARKIGRAGGRASAVVANLAKSMFGEWSSELDGGLAGFRAGGPFGQQFYSRRNVTQWMMAYGVNSRLRGPISRLATDVAAIDWHLYRQHPDDPEQRIKIHGHPLQKLIGGGGPINPGRPNPWLSWRDTVALNQTYNELAGEWFLWLRRPAPFAQPIEIWPIPPHWVASIPTWRQSKDGAVYFDPMYRFTFAGGEVMEMLMSEIVWHYEPNPLNPYWRGLGAAQAVDDEVQQLEWMAKYNNGFFRNSAAPGTIISVKGAKKKQLEDLETWWKTKHQGFARAFEPAFINDETAITNIGVDHNALQFDQSQQRLEATVGKNWQTPPVILGEKATRQDFDAALYQQSHQNVRPALTKVRDALNTYVVPLWGETDLFLDYDNPVKESNEFILRRTNEGLTRGALKVNQWLVPNGFPPLSAEEGGEDRLIPVNVAVMLPDGSMAVGPNQSQQGQPTGSPEDVVGPAPPRKALQAPAPVSEQVEVWKPKILRTNGIHGENGQESERFILVD